MIDRYSPSLVVAFPGGCGTADMVSRAIRAGIAIIGDGRTPAALRAQTLPSEAQPKITAMKHDKSHAGKQLEFAFNEAQQGPVAQPDPLVNRLIGAQLVPNEWLLMNNRGLTNPLPDALRSRLFRFPIEFVPRASSEENSRLLLRHPALANHPFVQQVAAQTGMTPVWEALDEFGRDRGEQGRWWHAVDLMSEQHWRDLLAMRQFTDDDAIAHDTGFALECNRISVTTARQVLGALGAVEPADRSRNLLMSDALYPTHIVETHPHTRKVLRERWPLNVRDHSPAGAWLVIHGIEDGWFERRRDGDLQLSAEGRRVRPEWRVGPLVRAGHDEIAFHTAHSALAGANVDAAGMAAIARAYIHEDGKWETREAAIGAIETEFYRRAQSVSEAQERSEQHPVR